MWYSWGIFAVEIILFIFLLIIIQPHKSAKHNALEVIHFLLYTMFVVSMLGVSVASLANVHLAKRAIIISYSIASLPIVYCIGIASHWLIGNGVIKQAAYQAKCCFIRKRDLTSSVQDDSLPDRLNNPVMYN